MPNSFKTSEPTASEHPRSPRIPPLLFALAVAMLALAGCGSTSLSVSFDNQVDGNGDITTTDFPVASFDRIDISDTFEANVSVGQQTTVKITSDTNLVEHLSVVVDNGELHIEIADGVAVGNATLEATIQVPELRQATISGASSAAITGAAGSPQAYEVSGASSLTIAGTGTDVSIIASGASTVDVNLLALDSAIVTGSGASEIFLSHAESVQGELSGASALTLPSDTSSTVATSGTSQVLRVDN